MQWGVPLITATQEAKIEELKCHETYRKQKSNVEMKIQII
jgi:hypothetical protein